MDFGPRDRSIVTYCKSGFSVVFAGVKLAGGRKCSADSSLPCNPIRYF
ncbi:MAG: hypothetical protein ACI9RU_000826 [Litorivivens sp.]